jgi:hypothetical protein
MVEIEKISLGKLVLAKADLAIQKARKVERGFRVFVKT